MLVAEKTIKSAIGQYYKAASEDAQRRAGEQAKLIDDLMAIKREKYQQGKSLKFLFFTIGLCMSMGLAIAVFQWKTYDSGDALEVATGSEPMEELIDIPSTQQPPPPPPKQVVQQPNIVEVEEVDELKEEIKIDFDIDISTEEVIEQIDNSNLQLEDIPDEEVAEEIFTIVETKPEPTMGMTDFMKYIYESIKYPPQALRAKVQGKIFVQFVVNSDGKLSDFNVLKGIGMGCDEEAVRVLQNAEPWKPGKQRGKPVKVRMVLPINFVYRER